ncbi:Deleted in malignant brain tumors 1 protein [Tetrabaena socialis]|uniref:Deleted in malignant brain tumors 1 protein n=1 Tax=Tetrabaena socialis TaxID=47790 RepID=A0A2J8A021_9CHLO|nr:Deleted in malignant brain tumors 1 protein [Tetrabaena socialis]|eukprot:PNH05855.1 Deleted in malignant brain tumors 1 protein [Tetrabaena socialis]
MEGSQQERGPGGGMSGFPWGAPPYGPARQQTIASVKRLSSGPSSRAGQVEVFYKGSWGTVCDDFFDEKAASVTCRQLGFAGGVAIHKAPFARGTGPIWMDDVLCLGHERRLWDCDARKPRGASNCDHSEDVAVECHEIAPPPPPSPPAPPMEPSAPDGTLRLVNGNSSLAGRVEVFMLGRWGTLCSDTWTVSTAQVACRQLGATGGTLLFGKQYGVTATPTGPVFLSDLYCDGTEPGIMSCEYDQLYNEGCEPYWAAAVMCGVEDGQLRLANGTDMSGRLEVLHNGAWGTVCADGFGETEADVACQQLGHSGGHVAAGLEFGAGRTAVWMDEVVCSGAESRLDECTFDGWAWTDCSHFNDVGLTCYDSNEKPGTEPYRPPQQGPHTPPQPSSPAAYGTYGTSTGAPGSPAPEQQQPPGAYGGMPPPLYTVSSLPSYYGYGAYENLRPVYGSYMDLAIPRRALSTNDQSAHTSSQGDGVAADGAAGPRPRKVLQR